MLVYQKYKGVLTGAFCFCLMAAVSIGALADGVRTVTIPKVTAAPVMNGDLGDSAWSKGAFPGEFSSVSDAGKPIQQQTSVYAVYDSKCLYVGIKCHESNMAAVRSRSFGRDSSVWTDDCVEVYLDTTNSEHMLNHFMINPIGGYFESKSIAAGQPGGRWDSHSIIRTSKGTDGWTIELAVPFSDLNAVPTAGQVWGINICRGRRAGTEEYSTWSPSPGGFEEPQYFGRMIFGDAGGKWDGIRLVSWGDMSAKNASGTVKCSVPGVSSKSTQCTAVLKQVRNGKTAFTTIKTISVAAGTVGEFEIPYSTSGHGISTWYLDIKTDDGRTFKAENRAEEAGEVQRVWKVKDPLYKELLSNVPAGEQKSGAIYWGHTYAPSLLQPFAKEYGFRYSSEEALQELVDSKLLMIPWPVRVDSILGDPFLTKSADKSGLKVLFYPDEVTWLTPEVPKLSESPFELDPRSRANYFNDLKTTLAKGHKYIWGIYTGDEMTEHNTNIALQLFWDYKDKYPYIKEIDEMIKKECGFGKYGFPLSAADTNPYRWIATRRWINNYILRWQKEVYETVQSIAPDVRVISIDPTAGHHPVEFDRLAPYIDVATHQLYPPTDPNRQQFGFTTKMVADFTEKPVWPCTHVEYYPFSTTLDETRELMSEVQRNGGKGFHFWLKDEFGNNAPTGFLYSTKWGFPARWKTICGINKMNAKMNEVAVPTDPDSAIFYSEDYYQSFVKESATNEPEWAYTFFGPVAQTWFKFINDNMIEDGKVDFAKYKAVILPIAKYERANVADSLVKYAENGGTILLGDADSFQTDLEGNALTTAHEKLIGGTFGLAGMQKTMTFSSTCSLPSLRNRTLSVFAPIYAGQIPAGSEIMATFADGSPAVYRKPVGTGSAIVFLSSPFTEGAIGDEAWKGFFKALSKDLGLKMDRQIWRFEFPEIKNAVTPDPKGLCLTGNYVKWWQDKPEYVQDASIAGNYSYSIAPDAISDRGSDKVSFSEGKLLDRKQAYTALKKDMKAEDFVVSWKTEKPVSVTFDLLSNHNVSRIHLWYSGQFSGVQVEGSADGTTWKKIGEVGKKPFVGLPDGYEDILDTTIDLRKGVPSRYIRLSFGARDAGNYLTLAECEIWGDK